MSTPSRVLAMAARAHRASGFPAKEELAGLNEQEHRLLIDVMTALKINGHVPTDIQQRAGYIEAGGILPDNDEHVRQHMAQLQARLAQEAEGERMMRRPGIDAVAAAHVCRTPVDDLTPITVGALKRGVNHGTKMLLEVVAPVSMVVSIAALCEDVDGRMLQLACYNFLEDDACIADAQRVLPVGSRLTLLEPYFKMTNSGGLGLRVDNPCNLIISAPLHPSIAAATSPAQLKDAGNALFTTKDWVGAAEAYTRALGRDEGASSDSSLTVTLLSNRAAARLKLLDFDGALADADSTLALCPTHAKAAFRRGQALLGLHRYSDAAAALATFMSAFEARGESADAPMPKLLATARACIAQARGTFDHLTLPLTPEQQASECIADFIGPVEVRATRDRGWGLFVTRDVPAGTLLFVESALGFSWEPLGQETTAVDYSRKLSSSGSTYGMTSTLIHAASSSPALRAKLALLAWKRTADGGREPGSQPPPMQQLRDGSLAPYEHHLSAERVTGVTDVNTFSCYACIAASPVAREALAFCFGGKRQPPKLVDNGHAPRRIEANPRNDVGAVVLATQADAAYLRRLMGTRSKARLAKELAETDEPCGLTPLHYAVLVQRHEMVGAMVEAGAPLNIGDDLGMTPLHYAAGEYYNPHALATLLRAGADANARSLRGLTPLHAAVTMDRPEAVTALLGAGADPYLPDCSDWLPPLCFQRSGGDRDTSPRVRAAFAAAGHTDDSLAKRWRECSGVWFVASFLNHATAPSVSRLCVGRLMVVTAAVGLRPGDELTTSYGAGPMLAKWGIVE